jgi:phage terminase large subunit-like protein
MTVYSQRAVLAGTGAGKTICGLYEDIRWALAYPGSVGFIFEPNFPMIRRILLPTLSSSWLLGEPFTANPLIAEYSKQDQRLDWKNGSQWWFISLDDPEKSEGPNVDYAHIDEARLVAHFGLAWKTILRRLRGSGRCKTQLTPSVWITTTPDAPGTELFDATENPKTRSPNCRVYRWSIFQNPKLPRGYVEEMVRTHTGGLAQRFIYGLFSAVGVGSFPFDQTLHVREAIQDDIKKYKVGVDFGWTNPTAIIIVGYDGDGRAWILDEFYRRQAGKDAIIQALSEFKVEYGPADILCDPSAPETIDQIKKAGFNARAYEFKRADGLRELGGRFAKAGDGAPRIFISKRCVNLISELMEYKEEVKENDHAVDALRYALEVKKQDFRAFRFG